MALTVGELEVVLRGDPAPLNRAFSQAESSGKQFGSTVDGIASKAKTALAGIGAGLAIKEVFGDAIKLGVQFQGNLNTLGAVTGATTQQMSKASATAKALGADNSLAATSAADAAEAMTELGKGGLSVDQSMAAAKGTLQLAAAAQIDGANAAKIQSDALNAFGLSADQAGHVADVLANTANAASGDITDFAQGMAQVSAVAHGLGISLDDTSAALGLFANNGIKGSDAGTSLKSMLVALSSPTKQQAAALSELGVQAFDAQGNFVGLEAISGQLADASARMTDEQFAAAAATAFGTDAVRAATVFAKEGAKGFDEMSEAVGRSGGAAALADAQMKGLGGAWEALKSEFETVQIDWFEDVAGGLERLVRYVGDNLPELTSGFSEFAASVTNALSSIGMQSVEDALVILQALNPLLGITSDLIDVFSELPGPVQTALLALLLMQKIKGPVDGAFDSVKGAIRGFREEMQLQNALANGVMGGYQRLGDEAQIAGGKLSTASAFAATAAARMRSVGSSLLGALGGPVGLAITGVTLGLGFLADANADAAAAAADLERYQQDLADALKESNGVIDDNVRAVAAKEAQDKGLLDLADDLGISYKTVIDGMMGEKGAIEEVNKAYDAYIDKRVTKHPGLETSAQDYDDVKTSVMSAKASFDALNGSVPKSVADQKQLSDAMDESEISADGAADSASGLAGANGQIQSAAQEAEDALQNMIDTLEKLKDQQLAGEDAAQQVNDTMRELPEAFAAAREEAANTGIALLDSSGAINTATESGSQLYSQMKDLSDGYVSTYEAAVQAAQAQGQTLPEAQATALASTAGLRQGFIDAAVAAGFSSDEAIALAQHYLDIPASVSTTVSQPGMTEAQQAAVILGQNVIDIPDSKTVHTQALTADAEALLATLGFNVEHLPDGTVNVTASTADAQAALDTYIANNNNRMLNVQVNTVLAGGNGSGVLGASFIAQARGGILYNAPGHLAAAKAMPGSMATYVPPGTLRVVGDRLDVPELFAPLDGSDRTARLIREAAEHEGIAVVPTAGYGGGPSMGGRSAYDPSAGGDRAGVYRAGDTYQLTVNYPPTVPTEKAIEDMFDRRDFLLGGRR